MIRDFFEHLCWELRSVHFEASTMGAGTDPELEDQLARYIKKHGSCALLCETRLKTTGESEDRIREAKSRLRASRATWSKEQLDHLEALRPVIEEAFACAAARRTISERTVKVSELLEGEG